MTALFRRLFGRKQPIDRPADICRVYGHVQATDGSWVFGGKVCGRCYEFYDFLPAEIRQVMADAINALPPEQQQLAAARMSGGGPSNKSGTAS